MTNCRIAKRVDGQRIGQRTRWLVISSPAGFETLVERMQHLPSAGCSSTTPSRCWARRAPHRRPVRARRIPLSLVRIRRAGRGPAAHGSGVGAGVAAERVEGDDDHVVERALAVAGRQRPYRATTLPDDAATATADLVARDSTADAPSVKLVGDITYIRTWQGRLHLATVMGGPRPRHGPIARPPAAWARRRAAAPQDAGGAPVVAAPPARRRDSRVHRRTQSAERAAAIYWENHDLVLKTNTGRPVSQRDAHRSWTPILDQAGVEHRGIHHLRHAFGTALAERGAYERVAQHVAGHEDGRMTRDIYTHVTRVMLDGAAEAIEDAARDVRDRANGSRDGSQAADDED